MITQTQRLLLKILSAALFGTPKPDMKDAEWTKLVDESENQAVFPLMFSTVLTEAEKAIPPETFCQYTRKLDRYTSEAIKNNYYHGELHNLLTANGIPYVIMKGQASAEYYPDPTLRTYGDVDFLVKKEDLKRAERVLVQQGYKKLPNQEHECHRVFYRDDETLEMHWEPNGIPEGEKGTLCRKYLADCIDKSHISVDAEFYSLPDPFHHGLIMLLHTARHLIHTGIGLRHLCDWAVFMNSFDENTFIGLFEEKLKAIGLWQFTRLLTALSTTYFGLKERAWAKDAAEPEYLEIVLDDLLEGGNFGCKDRERINGAKLVTTKGRMKGNMVTQLFASLTLKAKIAMPVCSRIPLLLPIGWIYISIRQLLRIRYGKRNRIHVRQMIQNASSRRQIYSRFELFK